MVCGSLLPKFSSAGNTTKLSYAELQENKKYVVLWVKENKLPSL